MGYYTYSERVEYILELVKKEQLCSPKELAKKFDCSEKTIRNMINFLRDKGFDIQYCKKRKKYFLHSNLN